MTNDDLDAIALVVKNLGGKVVDNTEFFTFELPMSEVRTVVPKISDTLGLGVRKVGEYRDQHPTRHELHSVCRLELYYRPEQPERLEEKF